MKKIHLNISKNKASFLRCLGAFALLCSLLFCYACSEEPVGQQPTDSLPPGSVSNIEVHNISGGAIIRYIVPDDEDLLYVKAVYSLNNDGVLSDARASVYTDSLKIEGFGDTLAHEVKLIAVDRSQNESPAEIATIRPLKPDVFSIEESLTLVTDFGGIHAYWDNPNQAEISVVILKKDHNDEYVPFETFYSSKAAGDGSVREMDTIQGDFAVYVQDRWEHKSATKYYTLTPLYETRFDPLKFSAVYLPSDIPEYSDDYGIYRIWDGVRGDDPCFSSPAGTGIWPQWITMDLGILAKLSRIRVYQRTWIDSYIWAEGNLRRFEIWGSETLDVSGSWDSWTLLMSCVSIKPSGLPMGQYTDEDLNVAYNGEDFLNSPENPKVRYIRIKVTETWQGGSGFQIGEIDFYGDNR
jgi:hypothetical protein